MTTLAYAAAVFVLVILMSLPAYAVAARRRPILLDADVAARPITLLLGRWIRGWVMWLIAPLERALVRGGVSPDALNYAGGAFGLAAGIAYAKGAVALGGEFLLLGGLSDILDGRIARARGVVSDHGEFLDSVIDRFSEMFAFVGLAVFFAPAFWGTLGTALALGGSMLVSYTRAKGALVGVDYRGGLMARAERLVLLAIGSLTDGPLCGYFGWRENSVLITVLIVIGVGATLTAAWRARVVLRELRKAVRSP